MQPALLSLLLPDRDTVLPALAREWSPVHSSSSKAAGAGGAPDEGNTVAAASSIV